jgi:hypothetical protein
MSLKITRVEQMKLAMKEKKFGTFAYFSTRQKTLEEWLRWVSDYSFLLCASYKFIFICEYCGSKDHINYQCEYNVDTILASYNRSNKCYVDMEVLERVLYTGCYELLARLSNIDEKNKALDKIYGVVYPIYSYCYDNFSSNALVNTSHERSSTAVERTNLLQDSQKKEEDARRSEHTTATGMDLTCIYDLLDGYAKTFCSSYVETCDRCMAVGHFSFQCSFTLEESLVSYTRVEVLEYLVYKGVHDLLLKNLL